MAAYQPKQRKITKSQKEEWKNAVDDYDEMCEIRDDYDCDRDEKYEEAYYLASELVEQIKLIGCNCTPELEARIEKMLKQEFPEEMI